MKHNQRSASPCELACQFDAPPRSAKRKSKNDHAGIVPSFVSIPNKKCSRHPALAPSARSASPRDIPLLLPAFIHCATHCAAGSTTFLFTSIHLTAYFNSSFCYRFLAPRSTKYAQNCTNRKTADHLFSQLISPKISLPCPTPPFAHRSAEHPSLRLSITHRNFVIVLQSLPFYIV